MAALLLVLWFVIATAVVAGVLVGTAIAAPRPAAPATARQAEGPDWSPGPSRPVHDTDRRITSSPAVAGSSPQPTSAPRTAKPSAVPMAPAAADVPPTVAGVASTYGPGWDGWLALPEGPGVRVRVCGTAACLVRTSTDAGPSLAMQRRGRVVDLDVPDFEAACGCSWRTGLIPVTVEYLE